jgi:hypothetical protein
VRRGRSAAVGGALAAQHEKHIELLEDALFSNTRRKR